MRRVSSHTSASEAHPGEYRFISNLIPPSWRRLGDDLVLCTGSVAPIPLEDVVPAAAEAGFDGISILARPHSRARRAGRTNRELFELIRDNGLFVSEIEAAGDWLGPVPFPAEGMFHPV